MKNALNLTKRLAAGLSVLLLSLGLAHAEEGVLRWGADSEGGAPFVFQDPANPEKLVGFEVELAEALAKEMGMEPEFVQNQWDGLVPGLNRGNYDIIMNGLEITDERKEEISFSEPYYVTYEQITVRKDNHDIHSLETLKGKVVGTLKASLAEDIMRDFGGIEIRSYDDDTNSYTDLGNGRLDAVMLDHPIAIYKAKHDEKLKFVGLPISRMEYGIGIRKEDEKLLADVNAALQKLKESGKLREILERWAIWNPMMADYLQDRDASNVEPTAYLSYLKSIGIERSWKDKVSQYTGFLPLLAKGAVITLELTTLGMILAVTLGLMITLVRLYAPAPFSWLAVTYVELVRGTPLLIQLFIIFYGLPLLGLKLTPFVAAVLGLGLNYAAYEAENYRAGILSIPRTQMDAALALGMTPLQSLRHIIVPQAMRLVIPPVTNDFISLLKDSSLVSVITMVELTKVYGQLAATYFDYLGIGLLTAGMYFLIGLPFVQLSRYAERHFRFDRNREGSKDSSQVAMPVPAAGHHY